MINRTQEEYNRIAAEACLEFAAKLKAITKALDHGLEGCDSRITDMVNRIAGQDILDDIGRDFESLGNLLCTWDDEAVR